MGLLIASILVWIVAVYAATGLLFAVVFLATGLATFDPAAHRSPWSFRLLIIPGVAAFWPWLLVRWTRAPRRGIHP